MQKCPKCNHEYADDRTTIIWPAINVLDINEDTYDSFFDHEHFQCPKCGEIYEQKIEGYIPLKDRTERERSSIIASDWIRTK